MHSIDQLIRNAADAPLGTVIHVGAGRGAVLEQYARLAPARAVLVEGDPATASTLQRAARPYPWAQVVSQAAGAATGDVSWNRYNLPALNGPLDVAALSGSYPRLYRQDATSVPAVALSTLVSDALEQAPADRSNLLVLDVPGQEAALLESLGDELIGLSALIVRRCAVRLPGAAQWATVLKRLRERAFELGGHEAGSEPFWPVAYFRFDRRRHEIGALCGQVETLQVRLRDLESDLLQARSDAQEAAVMQVQRTESLEAMWAATARLMQEKIDAESRATGLEKALGNASEELRQKAQQIANLTEAATASERLAADRADRLEQMTEQVIERERREADLTGARADVESVSRERMAMLVSTCDEQKVRLTAYREELETMEKANIEVERQRRQLEQVCSMAAQRTVTLEACVSQMQSRLNACLELRARLETDFADLRSQYSAQALAMRERDGLIDLLASTLVATRSQLNAQGDGVGETFETPACVPGGRGEKGDRGKTSGSLRRAVPASFDSTEGRP